MTKPEKCCSEKEHCCKKYNCRKKMYREHWKPIMEQVEKAEQERLEKARELMRHL